MHPVFATVPATVADIFRYFLQVLSRKCFRRRIRAGGRGGNEARVRVLLISGRFGTLASRRPVASDKGERRIFCASSRFECRDSGRGGCQRTFRRVVAPRFHRASTHDLDPDTGKFDSNLDLSAAGASLSVSPESQSTPGPVVFSHSPLRFAFPLATSTTTVETGREKGCGRKEETGGERGRVDAKILQRSWK